MSSHRSCSRRRSLLSLLPLVLLAGCSQYDGTEQGAELTARLTTTGLFYQGNNFSGAERGFGAAIEESWGPALPGVEG
jgi:hypothetical protein